MAGCIVIRAAFAICACSLIIACDAISSEKGSPPDDETIDRLNRERVEERKRDVELVREYRSWQARLRATEHASLGLPLDNTFGPVTADSRFCERLPSQPIPSPERLAAEYREHADRFRAAVFPEDEESYRAHYFAERHMTRLACLVHLGGEGHKRTFVALLDHERPAVRFTAALHAINRDIAPDVGYRVLRDNTAGSWQFFTHASAKALAQDAPPLELGFDANHELDHVLSRVEGRSWQHVRLGRGSVR